MKKVGINLKKIDKDIFDLIANFLDKGRVIAYPTDTIYGLGCRADKKNAIKKIFKIKQRKSDQPLLILVSSINMAKKYCHINKRQEAYLKKKWPGPFTFILEGKNKLPKELSGGATTIAVRLPKNDFILKVIERIKLPLVSTSLNISGKESLTRVDGLEKYFNPPNPLLERGRVALPDLIIDAGEIKGAPSTLIDLRDMENIKVLRK